MTNSENGYYVRGVIIGAVAGLIIMFIAMREARCDPDYNQIVNAIWRIEGGAKTRFPYGIKSIPCSGQECRRIAYNTVRNNYKRWGKAGGHGDYIDFLADRYCPPKSDLKGNRNWKQNMRRILNEKNIL